MLLIKEINMQRGHNKAAKRVLEAQVTTTLVFEAFVRWVRVSVQVTAVQDYIPQST